MRPIDLLVIHCTATPNGVHRSVAQIRYDHMHREPPFSDIGYHYVIDVDGVVYPGRPEAQVGAHAAVAGHRYNQTSIGISLVGGLGGPDKLNPGVYSDAQWASLRTLVQDLLARFPGAAIKGHRDLSPDLDHDGQVESNEWLKLCPCFDVASWVKRGMIPSPSQRS
jgi:N-acetylmuramoyl-L-alanine amidase